MLIRVFCVWKPFGGPFLPRFGLLLDESLWLDSEDADVLSVELDLTESTNGTEALGGLDLGLATAPTDAELLHSGRQHQTRVRRNEAQRCLYFS